MIYRQFQGVTPIIEGIAPINYDKLTEKEGRSFGPMAITKPLNGALLSACASHELSADAYINKRYNGAFTHYLLKNLLQFSDSKTMQAIIKLVNMDLDKNGYDQNPEIEGLLENKTFFI